MLVCLLSLAWALQDGPAPIFGLDGIGLFLHIKAPLKRG